MKLYNQDDKRLETVFSTYENLNLWFSFVFSQSVYYFKRETILQVLIISRLHEHLKFLKPKPFSPSFHMIVNAISKNSEILACLLYCEKVNQNINSLLDIVCLYFIFICYGNYLNEYGSYYSTDHVMIKWKQSLTNSDNRTFNVDSFQIERFIIYGFPFTSKVERNRM